MLNIFYIVYTQMGYLSFFYMFVIGFDHADLKSNQNRSFNRRKCISSLIIRWIVKSDWQVVWGNGWEKGLANISAYFSNNTMFKEMNGINLQATCTTKQICSTGAGVPFR